MITTLYLPQQLPQVVFPKSASPLTPNSNFVNIPEWVPDLLGCMPKIVDVLASGPGYIVYSVFDYEDGPVNEGGMRELSVLTGTAFKPDDEDSMLLGPVLIVRW